VDQETVSREGQPQAGPQAPKKEFRTSDVKSLSCGVYNIPENKVCGACGANLPLIYDKDGKVFHWETDSPYWDAMHPKKGKGSMRSGASPWMIRVVAVLVAVLFALWLMMRHKP